MEGSDHWFLYVDNDEARRTRITRLLPEPQITVCPNWKEAVLATALRFPSVIVAPIAEAADLFSFIQDCHGTFTVALLGSMHDSEAASMLVQFAAAGQVFVAIDEDLPDHDLSAEFVRLFRLRQSGRVPTRPGTRARLAELATEVEVIDIGNTGCALLIKLEDAPERFLYGTEVGPLVILNDEGTILNAKSARVRSTIRLEGGRFRIGLELPTGSESRVRPKLVTDSARIGAAFLRMQRRREPVMLGHPWGAERHTRTLIADVKTACAQVDIALPPDSRQAFEPHDVLQITCDLGGVVHEAHVSVIKNMNGYLEIAMPRVLHTKHQRDIVRVAPPDSHRISVKLRVPATGERLFRPALDVNQRGLSFAIDADREILPAGTLLDDLELSLPDGSQARCAGVVRAISPLVGRALGFGRPYRCGVELTEVPAPARRALVDTLIASRYPRLIDTSNVPFETVWNLMAEAKAAFPDYPPTPGPHLSILQAAHDTLARADHGLGRSFLFRNNDGSFSGHASGLRLYSRTWILQHLASIGTKEKGAAVARELSSSIIEYVEACDDLEYFTCLWRKGTSWVHRYTALMARGAENGALLDLQTFHLMLLSPQAPAPSVRHGVEIWPMTQRDLPAVAAALRQRFGPLLMDSMDLSPDELRLPTLGARYSASGLVRRREVLCGFVDGELVGLVLVNDTTPGLCWPELTNAFSLVLAAPDHPRSSAVAHSLLARAVEFRRERFVGSVIGLADPDQIGEYTAAGFKEIGTLFWWTSHRRVMRQWLNTFWSAMEANISFGERKTTKMAKMV